MQQQLSFVFDIKFDEKYILFTLTKTAQRKISIKNNELQMHISAQSTTMMALPIELMQSIATDCDSLQSIR
jgi:hypothetical protein